MNNKLFTCRDNIWRTGRTKVKEGRWTNLTRQLRTKKSPITSPSPSSNQQSTLTMMFTQEMTKGWQTNIQTMLTRGFAQVQSELVQIKDQMKTQEENLSGQITEVKQQVLENKKEMTKLTKTMKKMESSVAEVQRRMEEVEMTQTGDGALMIKLELERAAYMIRLQNIPEDKQECLMELISNELAPHLEMEKEEVEGQIDVLYRMNSGFAKRNSLPREVRVKFTKQAMRDTVLKTMQGKTLTIKEN